MLAPVISSLDEIYCIDIGFVPVYSSVMLINLSEIIFVSRHVCEIERTDATVDERLIFLYD